MSLNNIVFILILVYLTSSHISFSQTQTQTNSDQSVKNDEVNVSQPIDNSEQKNEENVPKFSEFQSFLEPFIYDPRNRKDPFRPYIEVSPSEQGEIQGPLLPLQRFDLNEIRLMGIIWDVEEPKAMFLDPSKTMHIIGRNERIGRNNGYLAVIREGEVVVVEATRKEDEIIYTTTVMKMVK